MKLIQLAWTRDFSLAWAQWWTTLANPELIKIIGVGVDSQLSYFNGLLLETYRLQEETETFLLSVMNLGTDNSFFSEKKIKKYIAMIKEIRSIILNHNPSDFLKIKELSIETYPWYTVCYLLPQEKWASLFLAKNPNNKIIIKRLIEARKESEGVIGELCEYWRSISRQLLEKRKISEKYNGVVTFKEIEEMLKTPSYIPDKKELEKRLKGYIYFKDRVYTGISLSEFFQKQSFFYQEDKVDNAISELKGNVASSHNKIIQGKAQIILHKDQVPLFKSGNILITIMTTPLFLPAMKKAKAIITDEGGLTCHAAITARELGIPCIIGTKVATKIFKDNDLIEVDAEKGLIKKIKENTIEDNLPRLDFTKIAKLDWEKKWARNFTLLLCSYLGYQYYYSCRDLFEGNTFNAVLIRQFDEITTAYQLISDNERIGNYVVEKIDGKAETVKGYAEELRERTDLLSLRLKRPIYFLEKKKGFQQFETQLNEYSPIFFRLIRAANCLPGHLKESLLPIMDEIRIYTDPIFDEIDGYMKKIAEYISKKEKIPSKLCECLLREEVGEYFQKHRLPKISVLQERLRGCGLYFENGKETVLSKKETMGLIQAIFPAKENPELKGSSASPGIVKGLARIILDPQKPGLFKPGDIIIAEMTHPGYLLLMKQAKAIVTDAGGALCHAAVVAREFKIPCVVGTQIATEVLKDGDLIEVNAVKGVVKKIPEKQASKKKDKTKIKNPKNTIKLIIFDNYGVTLHGGYPDTMQHLAKEFHRDWKELQEIFYTKYFNQAVEQKISQQEAWKKAIDETKLPISVEEVKKIHYHYFQLNHDIINLAKKLSKRYTILLLTKNTKGQVEDADKKLGFRKIFPNFINTGEYGLTKTSPEMFKIIFKKFNVHPEECIYIDDQTINLEAPQRLGIHTIHYQNIKQLKEELKRII